MSSSQLGPRQAVEWIVQALGLWLDVMILGRERHEAALRSRLSFFGPATGVVRNVELSSQPRGHHGRDK